MLSSIVGSSLRLRFVVVGIAAAVMVLGVTQLRDAPVDVLPEFAPPYVEIQTESLGLSAEEVEQLITVPMEQDLLNGVPWLDTIRSESVPGLSSIVLVFQPGTDLMRARQMVSERMTQAVALPHVSRPPTMLQPLSATSRVMIVGLSSKSLSLIQMGVLARWTIAPRLLGVPGVANVAAWGQRDLQLQVRVDPERMRTHEVPLTNVLETTGNALWVSTLSFVEASTPGTGGFVDTPNQRLGIMHISPIITADSLAQVPISGIKNSDGTPLRLSDVADVVEDHQPLIGDAMLGDNPGLLLVIEKFPGANTLDVTRGVEAALEEMQSGLPGVDVNTAVYRPATFIEQALLNLSWALLFGYAMVVLVLGVFYWSWRMALISAVAIPLSLVAAGLVLYLRGATMNVMILAGFLIAVGAVIDDAIIDVENIMRRLRQNREEGNTKSSASLVLEASTEVRSVITFAMLIVMLAILPVFSMAGLANSFFRPVAISYLVALLASVLVALTVTPALITLLLPGGSVGTRRSPLISWLQRGYGWLLSRTVRRSRLAYLIAAVLVLAGLGGVPFLRQELLPSFREPQFMIQLKGMPGMSQPEMSRIAGLLSRELRSIPGVRDIGAHVGRAILGDQVVGVNSASLWVSVDPSTNYDRTVAAVQQAVRGYPGLHGDVQTYLQETSRGVVAQPKNVVTVRIYGDNDDVLRAKAEDVRKAMAGVHGIVASHVDLPPLELVLETRVDLQAAQRYGLKPGDVRRAAATLLSGIQVGNLFEEQKIFDVVVWSTPETRHSPGSVRDLPVDTPDGGHVRLGDVSEVRLVPTSSVIRHEAVKRYADVVADVRGRDLGAVAADIKTSLQQVQFPLEYYAVVLGDYTDRQTGQARVLGFVAAALIGIFFLLQAAFGSWRLAILSFLTLPSALVGGLLAAFLAGGILSLGSLVGFLTVFGIAARNGIMLINHYQHLERHEGEAFGPGLVLRGARERLSPILMTALATALALAPALFLGDIPGLEIVRPVAIVVLGGLVTSTILNLFILPALYLRIAVSHVRDFELGPDTLVLQ